MYLRVSLNCMGQRKGCLVVGDDVPRLHFATSRCEGMEERLLLATSPAGAPVRLPDNRAPLSSHNSHMLTQSVLVLRRCLPSRLLL